MSRTPTFTIGQYLEWFKQPYEIRLDSQSQRALNSKTLPRGVRVGIVTTLETAFEYGIPENLSITEFLRHPLFSECILAIQDQDIQGLTRLTFVLMGQQRQKWNRTKVETREQDTGRWISDK